MSLRSLGSSSTASATPVSACRTSIMFSARLDRFRRTLGSSAVKARHRHWVEAREADRPTRDRRTGLPLEHLCRGLCEVSQPLKGPAQKTGDLHLGDTDPSCDL